MVRMVEKLKSRSENISYTTGESDLEYFVLDTENPLEVRAYAVNNSPDLYGNLLRQNIRINQVDYQIWDVVVHYASLENKIQISIDSSPEKSKVTRSKSTVANYNLRDIATLGVTGPSFGGLINVTKDKVEGVDWYTDKPFKMQLNWSSRWGSIRPDYIQTILDLGACVNDTPVVLTYKNQELYFNRGTLLFLGASLNESSDQGASIVMRFEGRLGETINIGERTGAVVATLTCSITNGSVDVVSSTNTSSLAAGMSVSGNGIPSGTEILSVDSTTEFSLTKEATDTNATASLTFSWVPITKEGWQYAWVRTVKVKDTTTNIEVELPASLHIENLADYQDFAVLEVFDTIRLSNMQEDRDPDAQPELDI